jgi:hypothetical protein
LSRAVNEFNKLGIGFAFIGVLVLFAFLSHGNSDFWATNKINWDTIEKSLTNDGGASSYSPETIALILVWILLMMVGSYLLIHIHFRALREEKR